MLKATPRYHKYVGKLYIKEYPPVMEVHGEQQHLFLYSAMVRQKKRENMKNRKVRIRKSRKHQGCHVQER